MSDLRVPPAVSLAFERVVADVCHRAKLETEEWPLRAHELLNHLQDRWREGIEAGLGTDAAQERALQMFGKPETVARRMREPWWKRLLLQRRCRLHRNLIFITASSVCQGLSAAFTNNFEGTPVNTGTFTAGMFLNGLLALGSAWVIAWKPSATNLLLRGVLALRHVVWLLVLSGLLNILLIPPLMLWQAFGLKKLPDMPAGWVCAAVAAGFYAWLGAACLISECLNLAGRRRQTNPETLAFQVIR